MMKILLATAGVLLALVVPSQSPARPLTTLECESVANLIHTVATVRDNGVPQAEVIRIFEDEEPTAYAFMKAITETVYAWPASGQTPNYISQTFYADCIIDATPELPL